MKTQFAGLPRAKKLTGTTKQQVGLGNFKAVRRAHHGVEPRARLVGHSKRRYKDAIRLLRTAPDASAKLVQLREAKTLSMLNHHYRRVGHIDADFHDRCGHKNLHF